MIFVRVMAFTNICGVGFDSLSSSITFIVALASVITGFIIGLGYMLGEFLQNPKMVLWAKTEFVQLFISLGAVIILVGSISGICTIKIVELGEIFGVSNLDPNANIFDGAQLYLKTAIDYIKIGMKAARYHLGGYDVLNSYGLNLCGDNMGAGNVLLCLFGSAIGLGGGAGVGLSPTSGYGLAAGGVNFAFGSMIFAYLSAVNYIVILRYIYSGMVFFFLPAGMFLRAMPFMRQLGALLISISVSFLIVYPLVLSLFYLDIAKGKGAVPGNSILAPTSGEMYTAVSAYNKDVGNINAGNFFWPLDVANELFDQGGTKEFEIGQFTGHAILVGVFIPSLALLAAAASVMYINRFLGEEIELSRLIQMM